MMDDQIPLNAASRDAEKGLCSGTTKAYYRVPPRQKFAATHHLDDYRLAGSPSLPKQQLPEVAEAIQAYRTPSPEIVL
jgi:hypothetical protein